MRVCRCPGCTRAGRRANEMSRPPTRVGLMDQDGHRLEQPVIPSPDSPCSRVALGDGHAGPPDSHAAIGEAWLDPARD